MSHWNYRICREEVTYPGDRSDPTERKAWFYTLREVHYDDDGEVRAWTAEPTTFAGDTPGEVIEALLRASNAWPGGEVLDLATRETVLLTYHGKERTQ